jgi:hypothetical protein
MPNYAICVSESYMLNAFKANDAICHMCKDKVAAFLSFWLLYIICHGSHQISGSYLMDVIKAMGHIHTLATASYFLCCWQGMDVPMGSMAAMNIFKKQHKIC